MQHDCTDEHVTQGMLLSSRTSLGIECAKEPASIDGAFEPVSVLTYLLV